MVQNSINNLNYLEIIDTNIESFSLPIKFHLFFVSKFKKQYDCVILNNYKKKKLIRNGFINLNFIMPPLCYIKSRKAALYNLSPNGMLGEKGIVSWQ